MKVARITTVAALVATLAAPLAVSANPSTNNGQTLTDIETIRYGRSERSDPNWDRVESHSAGQGSSQAPTQR